MAITVVENTIPGGAMRFSASGWEDSRTFLVHGLEDSESERRKYLAMTQSRVPRRGDPHPAGIPCTVSDIDCVANADDNASFTVTVNYGGDTQGTADGLAGTGIKGLDITTSTVTVTRSEDLNGNLLKATYVGETFVVRFASFAPEQEFERSVTSRVYAAEYEESLLRASVTVERSIPSLGEHSRVGMRTNLFPWSGEPAYRWLLLGVESSINGQGSHDWRYHLARANDTWQFRVSVNDLLVNGIPVPTNPVLGNGIEYYDLYEAVDFATLGFEIPR